MPCESTQLYVNKDRAKSEDILRRVAQAGYKVPPDFPRSSTSPEG